VLIPFTGINIPSLLPLADLISFHSQCIYVYILTEGQGRRERGKGEVENDRQQNPQEIKLVFLYSYTST